MNIFFETINKTNFINRRLTIHSTYLIIVPIVLAVTLFALGSVSYRYRDLVTQYQIWISVYFIIMITIGVLLKIYNVMESFFFVLWMLVISCAVGYMMLMLIGLYTLFLFPIAFHCIGPIYNIQLGKKLKEWEIESFKKNIIEHPEYMDEGFETLTKENHSLSFDQINPSLIQKEIIQSERNGMHKFLITNVMNFENSQYLFVELKKQFSIIRVTKDHIQTVNITSGKQTVHLNSTQIVKQLDKLLK